MKVLLIQSSLGNYSTKIYPLGISYLAACLPNHSVKLMDLNIIDDPQNEIRKTIREFRPDVIGISLRNIDDQHRSNLRYFYRENFQKDVASVRETAPNVPLIAGGAGFSLFPIEIMTENPQIDFGVYLEGEESLPELLDNLSTPERVKGIYYRQNNTIQFTGPRSLPNFERLPHPRRDLLDVHAYTPLEGMGIQTTRGCSHSCSYCIYPFLGGGSVRGRKAADVVDEIQELLEKQKMNRFFFADSAFGLLRRNAEEICREIIRRKLPVRWGAYFDMKRPDENFYLLAHKAGCQDFVFSPDGYSPSALKGLNKGFTKKDIDDHISFFLNHPELKKTTVVYSFMINPPRESLIGLVKTLILIVKLKYILGGKKRGTACYSWIRLEPNTPLLETALFQGDLPAGKTLLPALGTDGDHVFYRHPRLYMADYVLMGVQRIVPQLKKLFL